MAKKKSRRRPPRRSTPITRAGGGLEPAAESGGEFGAQTTGRMIVTFADDSKRAVRSALATFKSKAGVSTVCHMADFGKAGFDMAQTQDADAVVFDELGIAVMGRDPDQVSAVATVGDTGGADVMVEPEYVNYAFDEGLDDDLSGGGAGWEAPDPTPGGAIGLSVDYLRGYGDAVDHLTGSVRGARSGASAVAGAFTPAAAFDDTRTATWGLQATEVLEAESGGRGINVCVLDTGFDLTHPDFAGRSVTGQSFVPGEAVQDGNGHGTHCIGTACGPREPGTGPRYGIAHEANIFVGKVLSNGGSGSDSSILSGINWALRNRCQIVSMSLGRRVRPGEQPMQSYERAGSRALRAGTLIIAAAGNDSSRPFSVIPVSSPANAATIAAVAALDSDLEVARFSNGGLNRGGGEINLAAPGVSVHSSWPMPVRLRSLNGTSMATPHVAGLAALVAQQVPSARGVRLYREIRSRAQRLALPRTDVGNGLARV